MIEAHRRLHPLELKPLVRRPLWQRLSRNLTTFVAAALMIELAISAYSGWSLTHPARLTLPHSSALMGLQFRDLVDTTKIYHIAFQDVAFPSRVDHLQLRGWALPATITSTRTVVLAHEYADNRLDSDIPGMQVMFWLVSHAYNVLTFDFRAEGQSPGNQVTLGLYEQRDVLGAVDFAATYFGSPNVAVMGFSMGGTTALLAAAQCTCIKAVIDDSGYDTLQNQIDQELPRFSHLPAWPFTPTIEWVTSTFEGLNPADVNALAVVRSIAPRKILFIHGLADHTVPYQDSVRLCRASGEDCRLYLWTVPGAGHLGSLKHRPLAYEDEVLNFLGQAMAPRSGGRP